MHVVGVKICGLNDANAVDAALAGGAALLGFVFFPKSPRHVSPAAAAALAAPARGRAGIVAVTVDADEALLTAIREALAPDWIQLHGSESPAAAARARRYSSRGVIKALPIAGAQDFAAADAYSDCAEMLLFDAKAPPGAALPGGNGAAFDWRLLQGRRFPRPWILSGGLSAENVGQAVALSGAAMVDVSSGVERAPGVKDPARITAFLAATQAL